RFHLAVIDDPAAAAPAAILPAPLLVVAVSELVRADMLTLPPGEQPGSDRCHRSCVLQCLREKRAGLWRSPPATSSPTAVAHIYRSPPSWVPEAFIHRPEIRLN